MQTQAPPSSVITAMCERRWIKKAKTGTTLAVQWLRLCSRAEGPGFNPWSEDPTGTKMKHSQINKYFFKKTWITYEVKIIFLKSRNRFIRALLSFVYYMRSLHPFIFLLISKHLVSTYSVLRRKKQSSDNIDLEYEGPEFNKWLLQVFWWMTLGKLFNPYKPGT